MSEKVERPLSQMRPSSAVEERENFKETKQKLTRYFFVVYNITHEDNKLLLFCRQLSASSERASQVSSTDKRLTHQLREGSQSVFLDSQTLRVRKMSLDNRYMGAIFNKCTHYVCISFLYRWVQ